MDRKYDALYVHIVALENYIYLFDRGGEWFMFRSR